jgi:hypothetical protein
VLVVADVHVPSPVDVDASATVSVTALDQVVAHVAVNSPVAMAMAMDPLVHPAVLMGPAA